jgi:hypothetical protein
LVFIGVDAVVVPVLIFGQFRSGHGVGWLVVMVGSLVRLSVDPGISEDGLWPFTNISNVR